ncbi:MAG: histidine phosphatase family protein [Dehalococcoidia bacterium]
MGRILIVNTGPTEFERHGLYPSAGSKDLEAPASRWAEAAAKRLADYQVIAVYACPVPGALETSDIIAASLGLKTVNMPGLEGAGLDRWKGLKPEEAADMDDCSRTRADYRLPFENMDNLQQKVAAVLDSLAAGHRKETVAVVSHRALSVIMILHFLNMQKKHYRQIAQDPGAINLFEIRGGMPSALIINDTCHLDGLI